MDKLIFLVIILGEILVFLAFETYVFYLQDKSIRGNHK